MSTPESEYPVQLAPGQIVLTDPLIVAVAQIEKLNASLKRMQEESGQQLERTRAERTLRLRTDHLNAALSLRNDDLCDQVDKLLLACEAIIDAADEGLPLDDAIAKVRATWLNYGPSDTAIGEGREETAAETTSGPDPAWPRRSPVDAAAIQAIRGEFQATGYSDVGSQLMWMEERFLEKSREVDALVAAIEACGPDTAAWTLVRADELKAPKAASNG